MMIGISKPLKNMSKKSALRLSIMMMFSHKIKVVLMTRHIPLREISKSLNERLISDTIYLVDEFFKKSLRITMMLY